MHRSEPSWMAALADRRAFPFDPDYGDGATERIDTHISTVFLTPTRAYKLRRPVTLSFVDFSTAAERVADCLREVALNRRLAREVYLGIAAIEDGAEGVRVGPAVEEPEQRDGVVEHCVVMRRLPAGRDLKSLLARGAATAAMIDRVAARLAAFHREASLGTPAPDGEARWLERSTAPARANIAALAEVPPDLAPPGEVEELRRLGEAFLERRREDFEARHAKGRAVDGHGDLHAEHVWFETDESEPLLVDCLEFRDDFRRIDAASDIAFLAMDLDYRGAPSLAARLLRRYARDSGDFHLFTVVDYFLSYRALVRAKVASLVAADESMPDERRAEARSSVRRHLDLGLDYLRERPPGAFVLTCGTIGTGKTTVAEELATRTGGVVLSSDRLRREMHAADRYSDAARSAVYEHMLAEARHVVESGRIAILDATWSRKSWRRMAADAARRSGTRALLVEVVADRDEVLERLSARAAAGNDASEAGPGLYDTMRAEFEEPDEWPPGERASLDSSKEDWPDRLGELATRFGLAPARR